MAELTGIGFSNFRVFKKKTFFDLSPISIFTGTNSSGKSSIFKGLLLLKDNATDPRKLSFSGEHHKLGTFKKTLNSDSENEQFRIRVKVNQEKGINIIDSFTYHGIYNQESGLSEDAILSQSYITYDDSTDIKNKIIISTQEQDIYYVLLVDFKLLMKEIKERKMPLVFEYEDYLSKCDLEYESPSFPQGVDYNLMDFVDYDFSIVDISKLNELMSSYPSSTIMEVSEIISEMILDRLSSVLIKKDNEGKSYSNVLGTADSYYDFIHNYANALQEEYFIFSNLLTKSISALAEESELSEYQNLIGDIKIKEIISERFLPFLREIILPRLKDIAKNLKEAFEEIQFIDAIRANSQRLYTNQSQGTAFNKLLLELGQSWDKFNSTNQSVFSAKRFVEKWLNQFGIGNAIEINRVKGIATEVIIIREGKRVDLIDLGYGVTQFLPILLYIAFKIDSKSEPEGLLASFEFNSRSTLPLLLIEEPESNLHPKLQSLLADFFIDVAKHFEVKLLIETHSEYLIRRLQVLTAAGEVKPDDSVIYYLDGNMPSDSDKFVRKININPDGSLTNDFGPGFIDEATNWKMELMRLKNAQLQNLN